MEAVAASRAERALFFVAAASNWLVAVAFVVPESLMWRIVGMRPPEQTLFLHLFAAIVAVFGCAYLWIALDASRKGALILIAVIGKLSVFAVLLGHYLAGSAPLAFVLLISGDLIFAVLFLGFLHRHATQLQMWSWTSGVREMGLQRAVEKGRRE